MSTIEDMKRKMMTEKISKFKLNEKQNQAYSLMASGKNVFITGPGGTGKTCLIKLFTQLYKNTRKIAVTSTTGTSALLINGVTLHSYLGVGFGNASVTSLVKKIKEASWLKKRWIELDCLVVDEVSMLNPELFDKLEEMARIIRKSTQKFGGIQIILSGDYLQLPVVGIDRFCFEANCWNECVEHTVYLTEIIRQDDIIFQNVLNNVRIGEITEDVKNVLNNRVGANITSQFGIRPTRLFSTNVDVDRINNLELDKLAENGADFFEYEMSIYVSGKVTNRNGAIEKFKKSCIVPENIQLCVGAQVMLLKNLDLANGLANGSRGVVSSFVEDLPMVKFLNGEERLIEMNVWEVEENEKPILSAQQIPLKVAYAYSIHKAQGITLDLAEIDLSNIFEYGQAYVALSRVRTLSGLSIKKIDYTNICAHPKAVEYYEKLI
jgi:ATP-dependent DNA helicase PIF1